MLRSRCVPRAISVAMPVVMCSLVASGYEPTWVPTGLGPGATYHLVFVTSTTTDAIDDTIAYYNNFVDARGDTLTGSPYGDIVWKCIGSTDSVDAKDNMGYSSSTSPVYRLDDVKVADNSADMWDGDIDTAISTDDQGNSGVSGSVWTGTGADGLAYPTRSLESSVPRYGRAEDGGSSWISSSNNMADFTLYRLYGFSEELTVAGSPGVPEPSTIVLSLMGLAAGAGLRRRRRRRQK